MKFYKPKNTDDMKFSFVSQQSLKKKIISSLDFENDNIENNIEDEVHEAFLKAMMIKEIGKLVSTSEEITRTYRIGEIPKEISSINLEITIYDKD